MSKCLRPIAKVLPLSLVLLLFTACGEREDTRTHEEIVKEDLAEILALQGSPCGEVNSYTLDKRLRYRVECENGEHYRIRVSSEGEIRVRKHQRKQEAKQSGASQ